MHDIVIRGGTIVDGTGKPAFTGDLAIAGERLVEVGGKLGHHGGEHVILQRCQGKVVPRSRSLH